MSGATTIVSAVSAVAAVAGAVGANIQGNKQAHAAAGASNQAQVDARKLYAQQDQENNRRNAKAPDTQALLSGNELAGLSGQSGTMLTSPMGIDPNSLSLGKNTLLGGGGA